MMSLTTHDHTMQRGGYEALALDKPLITSDWPVLRETFSAGTIYVDNSADAIAEAIMHARTEHLLLAAEMKCLRQERLIVFEDSLRVLQARLTDEAIIT